MAPGYAPASLAGPNRLCNNGIRNPVQRSTFWPVLNFRTFAVARLAAAAESGSKGSRAGFAARPPRLRRALPSETRCSGQNGCEDTGHDITGNAANPVGKRTQLALLARIRLLVGRLP